MSIGTEIGNIPTHIEGKDDIVEEEKKDPKNSDDNERVKFCGKTFPPDVSEVKMDFLEVAFRSSINERINAPEGTHDCIDNFCETERPNEAASKVSSSTEVKDSLMKMGQLDNVDTQPDDLSPSKVCIHSISPQETNPAKYGVHSNPIQDRSIKDREENKSKIGTESDRDPNIVLEDDCQLVSNGNQKKHNETSCNYPLKCFDAEPNNNVQHSGGEGNEVRHHLSQYNSMSATRNNDSIPLTEAELEIINDTSDEFLDTSTNVQEKSIHCKNDEPLNLKKCTTEIEIFSQMENVKKGNDTPINSALVDVFSKIVNKDCIDHNGPQNPCDNGVDNENLEIKLAAENMYSKIMKQSDREFEIKNTLDSKVNVSTDTLTGVVQNTVQLASDQMELVQNNSSVSAKHVGNSIEGSRNRTSHRALFLRGSFPRIALRDTGGMASIKRLQRQLSNESKRRENLVNKCNSKKSPVKGKMLIKKKVSVEKAMNKSRVVNTKIQDSTNYPNLKTLQVRLEKMDEKLLSKYNINLQNLHVRAAVKISNENLPSSKFTVSNFSKNKIKNFDHSSNCHLQEENNIGLVKNASVPAKDNTTMRKQMKLKSCEAKLKNASVHVLKIEDNLLLENGYKGYKPKKFKTSSVTKTTHRKNRNLPVVKSTTDENLDKEKTNQILNVNDVKYPAQILLSRIDTMYPNILKQTIKLNMNQKNKNTRNRVILKKGKTKSPPKTIINRNNGLKTVQIFVTKRGDVALSKSDRKKCNNRKTEPKSGAKTEQKNGANVCVAKNGAIHSIDTMQPQERLISKKQTVFEQHDLCENTVKASKISQKRKADSFNRVLINDFSKENVCLNGESWHLKQARVSLIKLDNSMLPKVTSPSVKKIESK